MTRTTIRRFLRRTLIIGSTFAALALGAGTLAGAASAAPLPGGLHPESFSIFVSTYDQNGTVYAQGPVRGFGELTDVSPSFVVLDLHYPRGTVDVVHSPANPGRINWFTCTETAVTFGNWEFVGGTGHDWGARGFGHFSEIDYTVLARSPFGQCEPLAPPRYFSVAVHAEGLASR